MLYAVLFGILLSVELHINSSDLMLVLVTVSCSWEHLFPFESYSSQLSKILFPLQNFEYAGYHLTLQVEDSELADVAAVSAGNNYEIGNMIADAMKKVGRQGVVTLEEGKSAENNLYVVEGMQFDRGYISPYFVTDSEKMTVEYENCKV